MFINLFKFCDVLINLIQLINIDPFKIVPFTIILTFRKDLYDHNFKSFSEVFTLLENVKMNTFISKNARLTVTPKEVVVDKKYTDFFDLNGTSFK